MTRLSRVRVTLTGFQGGPGVSTFYFLDTSTALASLHTLYGTIMASAPNTISAYIEPAGDIIEDTTGTLVGAWADSPQAIRPGEVVGTYSAPTGFLLRWNTDVIADGSRITGSTYCVPAAAAVFTATGQVSDATIVAQQAAGLQFIIEQSASFVVWHRPYAGRAAEAPSSSHPNGLPARASYPGSHALVTGCRVPSKAVVLTSRRD